MGQFRLDGNLVHCVTFFREKKYELVAAKLFKIILISELFLQNYFLVTIGKENIHFLWKRCI